MRLATEEEMEAEFPSFEVGALPVEPLLPATEMIDRRFSITSGSSSRGADICKDDGR